MKKIIMTLRNVFYCIVMFGSASHIKSYDEKDILISLLPTENFITMNIMNAGRLDSDLQRTFDVLIGHNLDGLLDLIVQSNNNILSTDNCKTCAIDALLKKVSKHKKLSVEELRTLQKMMAHLYQFVNVLQNLTNRTMLTSEQLIALKNLNISLIAKNNLQKQVRQAATQAALQSLQHIDMVNK